MRIKKNFTHLLAIAVLAGTTVVNSCSKDNTSDNEQQTPDYSQSGNWLSIPAKLYPVDVFYLYPTSWTNTDTIPVVSAIDDTSMLRMAPLAFLRQATAFQTVANVYAPFYRQGNVTKNSPSVTAGIPTSDATAAFDYYIKHFNNGRPFILAGHSQGSNVLSNMLAGYLKENPQVYSRMIAAYVIGYPVTKEYLKNNPHLKFATGPDDVGVIISYNTEAPDIAIKNPILWGMVGVVINPITWTRSQATATMEQGLGSLMKDATGSYFPVPQCADATIDTTLGVLFANSTYSSALAASTKGVYHNLDYPFYYFNLRENASRRIAKFLNR